jgi:Zn-dependent protease
MSEFLTFISVLFLAMVIHEYAHAWTAYQLGDPTAKLMGRMTLNPLKHIDPFGTVVLPLFLTVLHSMGSPFFPVILAKPVPVNFARLREPRRDMVLVGMAGPVINALLAVILSFFLRLKLSGDISEIITLSMTINLLLAVFNMVPIPPLDGSRLVMGLLPEPAARQYRRLERYGVFIVFALLPFGLFEKGVLPVTMYLVGLLGGIVA